MIRKATQKDLTLVAKLLKAMYTELKASEELYLDKFEELAQHHLANDDVWLYKTYALYIMRDETPCVYKVKQWNGVSVYILPERRKGTILARLYKHMFNHYKGVIMGFTEVASPHNEVLLKRHELLGHVYKMRRPL